MFERGTLNVTKTLTPTLEHGTTSPFYTHIVLPMVVALPLWFRLMQNFRRYRDTKQRWPHLGNAAKYALSHIIVIFGVFHPTATSAQTSYDQAWLCAYLVSTIYSFWWDVVMDWVFWFMCGNSSCVVASTGPTTPHHLPIETSRFVRTSVSLAKPRSALRDRMMYPSTFLYFCAIVLISWDVSCGHSP